MPEGRYVMEGILDVEKIPEQVCENDLIAAIRGGKQTCMDGLTALKWLSRSKSPRLKEVLGEVLSNRTLSAELRSTAAVELGKTAQPETEELLLPGLSAEEPSVVNRVASTLGRIGGKKALEALEAYEPAEGEVAPRSVTFARTLISYRLGLESHRLEPPSPKEVLKLAARTASTLKPEPVTAEDLKSLTHNLAYELAGVDLAGEGALLLSCEENDFLLVPAAEIQKAKSLAGLRQGNRVVLVVLKRTESLDRYSLFEYILSQPGDGGRILLIGVTSSGRPIHFGEIKSTPRQTTFVLHSLNTTLAPIVEIEGTYSPQKHELKLTKARVSQERPERQKKPAVPRQTELKVG